MKKILILCALMNSCVLVKAVTKINGVFKVPDNRSIRIFLKEVVPAGKGRTAYEQQLDIDQKRSFTMKPELKTAGFFSLSVVMENENNKSAYSSVVYLTPNSKLDVEYLDNGKFGLICNYSNMVDADNKALFEIHELYNAQLIALFGSTAEPIKQKEELKGFYTIADQVMARRELNLLVKKYIAFNAFDVYNANLYRLAMDYSRGSKNKVPLGTGYYAQPSDPLLYFNDPMILQFPGGVSNAIRYMEVCADMPVYKGRKSLLEINTIINLLKSKLKNQVLADKVMESLLSSFTSSYRMGADFNDDLKAFTATADQIKDLAVRAVVKKGFENLRYTMKGALWPSVQFEDAEGTRVSLDQFKGKYLFIDLWASWCVPCVKMTPFVQELEKQYQGKNINFVAISIDGNKQNWLSKMKELQMHGNQLLDVPGSFVKNLNVSGIPHYLIYDPDGKLVVYSAVMPNNPKIKETIDQLPGI